MVAIADVQMQAAAEPTPLRTTSFEGADAHLRTQAEPTVTGADFPLRSVEAVLSLLSSTRSPTHLVGFEFSGTVRTALERKGHVALSVDIRDCDIGGMHAILDIRDVIGLKHWDAVMLFPPCHQQLRHDHDCLRSKIADGRAFWGCLLVVWSIFVGAANADMVIVEQSDTIVVDYLDWASFGVVVTFFRTPMYGDVRDKSVRLFTFNAALPAFAAPQTAAYPQPNRTQFEFANADERDRVRSSWATLPCTALAVASASLVERPSVITLYQVAAHMFAANWFEEHGAVPYGFLSPSAQPPTQHSRLYQKRRGHGDGRNIDAALVTGATTAASLNEVQLALLQPDSFALGVTGNGYLSCSAPDYLSRPPKPPALQQGPAVPIPASIEPGAAHGDSVEIDPEHCVTLTPDLWSVEELAFCTAVLVYISVIAQPLILAHVNGMTVIGMATPVSSRPIFMKLIANLCAAILGCFQIPFMVGEYSPWLRLFTSPIPVLPPPSQVCRTSAQRLKAMAAGATFMWCTLAALRGTASEDLARRAVAAAQMFVHPVSSLPDAPIDGAPSFKFGLTKVTSMMTRPAPEYGADVAARLASLSIAEELLRSSFLAAVEQGSTLLDGWVERISPFDASTCPEGLLQCLPDFDDSRLDRVQLSKVPEPLRTPWVPPPPSQPPPADDEPVCVPSWRAILLPEALARAERWLRQALDDMNSVDEQLRRGVAPDLVQRDRPSPIAIGQTEVQPWAVGRVYDCTRRRSH